MLAKSNRFEEAAYHYYRVVQLNPDFRAGHLELGMVLQQSGRDADALLPLSVAQQLDNGQFDAHLYAGHSLTRLCRLDEARVAFQAACDRAPRNSLVWAALGESFAADQEYVDAERCLRVAIALDPSHCPAWHPLGQVLQALGRTQEAVQCYETALNLDANRVETLLALGLLCQRQGQALRAESLLQRAANLNPRAPEIHNALGNAAAQLDRFEEALTHMRRLCDCGAIMRPLA